MEEALNHARTGLEIANQSKMLLARSYGATVLDMIRQAKEERAPDTGSPGSTLPVNRDGRVKSGGCVP